MIWNHPNECYIRFIITEPEGEVIIKLILHKCIANIFREKVMFMQLNEATNNTVHISNHGEGSTFIALLEALKGSFIMTYTYYILLYYKLYYN